MNNTYFFRPAHAWIKRRTGHGEIVRIVADMEIEWDVLSYKLYTAYEEDPDYLGRILFDAEGYWIYDGEILSVAEQEQAARFIVNYVEGI